MVQMAMFIHNHIYVQKSTPLITLYGYQLPIKKPIIMFVVQTVADNRKEHFKISKMMFYDRKALIWHVHEYLQAGNI